MQIVLQIARSEMNEQIDLIGEMRLALARTSEGVTPEMGDLLSRMEARNSSFDEQLQKLAEARAEAVDDAAEYRKAIEAFMHLTEPEKSPWLTPARTIEIIHCDAVKALGSDAGKKLRADVREVERIVRRLKMLKPIITICMANP